MGERDEWDENTADSSSLLTAVDDEEITPLSDTPRRLYVAVLNGVQRGEIFTLQHETLIGRSPQCDIVLRDRDVSREHANLTIAEAGLVTISDLGSHNGTFVNEDRIERAVLQDGDTVALGGVRLVIFSGLSALGEDIERLLASTASMDSLTGLHTIDWLLARLRDALVEAQRKERSLSLVLFDIANIDRASRRSGRSSSELLIELARCVARNIPAEDIAVRYGGARFAVVCSHISPATVKLITKQVVAAMWSIKGLSETPKLRVGVATSSRDSRLHADELLSEAEQRLSLVRRRK